MAAGRVSVGDEVRVLPLGVTTLVAGIDRFEQPLQSAESTEAVVIRLADELDVGRGHMIVAASQGSAAARRFTADLCWMSDSQTLRPRQQFWIKHTTRRVKCMVESLDDRLDIETLERHQAPDHFALNDIGRVTIKVLEPIFADPYSTSRDTGSFILIDAATRLTVAAGMVREIDPDPGT